MSEIIALDLDKIESDCAIDWEDWLEKEKELIRVRFGTDPEAVKYWPDDYYEKMEEAWRQGFREPIQVFNDADVIRIDDGWHRTAICHKIGLRKIPAIFIR